MSIPRAPKPTFAPKHSPRPPRVCAPLSAFPRTSRPTPAHLRPHSDLPADPRLRTFARIPTYEPRHACALSCPTPRSGFAPSTYLRPYSDPLAAPRLHTFAPNPTTRLCPVCAPSPAFPPTSRAPFAHLHPHSHARAAPPLRTPFLFSTYFLNRFYVPVRQIIKRIYTNHLKYSYKSFKRVI